jgi:hypothetical protein
MFEGLKKRLQSNGEVTLSIHARPGMPVTQIREKLGDGSLKVDVAAKPEGGKANKELCKFLAKEFGVPQASVTLVLGSTSREKVVKIAL